MTDVPEAVDAWGIVWKLGVTALFVALNGFFVAAEFGLVKVRNTRVEALAKTGKRQAQATLTILANLNLYLSACQLGITISSLVLGWLAEPAVASLILMGAEAAGLPVANSRGLHFAALTIALSVITILHMTLGEQAPKIWALTKPEPAALMVAYPLIIFTATFRPFITLINAISNSLLRTVGVSEEDAHSEVHDIDELRAMLRAASLAGRISKRQSTLGQNVLGMMRLQVRHIMLPRVDVTWLSTAASVHENLRTVRTGGHSRYPLGDPDLDNPVGVILSRDLLAEMIDENAVDLVALARPLLTVSETQPVGRLIFELQSQHTHVALVVDEHGTAVGLAFLEDAIEEIVGPIHDELDVDKKWVERESDSSIVLAGSVPLPDAADILGIHPDSEADTIGGFVVSRLERIPKVGDVIELDDWKATVIAASRRRVTRVRFELRTTFSD
jgi:CBS domain containing-hemolysin-like protein